LNGVALNSIALNGFGFVAAACQTACLVLLRKTLWS